MIGTLESYRKMIRILWGGRTSCPIYIEVEDGERLCRALAGTAAGAVPKYDELCRRFLADKEDFSEEKLRRRGSPEGTATRTRYNVWKKSQRNIRMGSFKDVVGHKDIIQYIQQRGDGEQGVSRVYFKRRKRRGQEDAGGAFRETLLCEKKGPEPCGKCHSCIQAESGNHPDIIRVTHEKPKA